MLKSNLGLIFCWNKFLQMRHNYIKTNSSKDENIEKKISRFFFFGIISFSIFFTCVVDSLLELVRLTLPDWMFDDVCRRYSTSLKTFLSPPPGLCFMFDRDPILLSTLSSIFWSMICSKVQKGARKKERKSVGRKTQIVNTYQLSLWNQIFL